MTIGETKNLMAAIKLAYPEFNRDLLSEEHRAALNLWHRMLGQYDYSVCNAAFTQHIRECKFAPKIAEIIERIHMIDPRSKQEAPRIEDLDRMKRLLEKVRNQDGHLPNGAPALLPQRGDE